MLMLRSVNTICYAHLLLLIKHSDMFNMFKLIPALFLYKSYATHTNTSKRLNNTRIFLITHNVHLILSP